MTHLCLHSFWTGDGGECVCVGGVRFHALMRLLPTFEWCIFKGLLVTELQGMDTMANRMLLLFSV